MRSVLVITIFGVLGVTTVAQEPGRVFFAPDERVQAVQMKLDAELRAAVETRTTKGAPYSAEATTEFVQALADGNRILRKSVTKVYRDGEGRIRREPLTAIGEPGDKLAITISDPIAGTSIILNPETRVAYRTAPVVAVIAATNKIVAERRAREVSAREEVAVRLDPGEPIAGRAGGMRATPIEVYPDLESKLRVAHADRAGRQISREDLGTQTIEGVPAHGTRTTTVIAAGAIGNEQPITIVSEEWFSPDLQVLVMTRHNDPRSGETVYRLTNIVRAEPDRSLFEIPADYTVKDATKRSFAPALRKE